ncbi:MAG: hypothetical protein MZV63_04735 [Marinilabiliales bacterium]|nr:hypothetical protein [Marinilabiliales bacterium]
MTSPLLPCLLLKQRLVASDLPAHRRPISLRVLFPDLSHNTAVSPGRVTSRRGHTVHHHFTGGV